MQLAPCYAEHAATPHHTKPRRYHASTTALAMALAMSVGGREVAPRSPSHPDLCYAALPPLVAAPQTEQIGQKREHPPSLPKKKPKKAHSGYVLFAVSPPVLPPPLSPSPLLPPTSFRTRATIDALPCAIRSHHTVDQPGGGYVSDRLTLCPFLFFFPIRLPTATASTRKTPERRSTK